MSALFDFPNPVNEKAARVVAAGATTMALLVAIGGWGWVLVPLTWGFVARVATGPSLSPLGRLATRVVAPRLGPPRHTPGPPKRFAQGIGAAFTVTASVLWLAGHSGAARAVVGVLAVAAAAEAVFGFCLGCRVFAVLMRLGVVPAAVCAECDDLSLRLPGLTVSRD